MALSVNIDIAQDEKSYTPEYTPILNAFKCFIMWDNV